MLKPALSSMKIFASASLEAAAVSLGKSRSARKSVAHLLQVHAGARAKQPLDQLLRAHLQAENRDRAIFVERDVLGDVHGQRCFSHARPRGDDDHFGFVQAIVIRSRSVNPVAMPADSAMRLVEFLDRLDRLHHLVLHRQHLSFEAIFADGEDLLLHFVEQIVDFVLLLEASGARFRCRR